MSNPKLVIWIRPDDSEIELNEAKATVAKAISLGWVPKVAANAKRYGLETKKDDPKEDATKEDATKEDKKTTFTI